MEISEDKMLLHIAKYHTDYDLRIEAGEMLIEKSSNNIQLLIIYAGSEDLPEEVRLLAGKTAIDILVKEGDIDQIIFIAYSKDVPSNLREYAYASVDKACDIFIEKHCSDPHKIAKLARNIYVPSSTREKSGMKVIELLKKTDNADVLVEIANNDNYPIKVRIAAGREAIEIIAKDGDLDWMLGLSKSEDVPEEVRTYAASKLEYTAMHTIRYAIANGGFFHLERWLKKDIPENVKEIIGSALINEAVSCELTDFLVAFSGNRDAPAQIRIRAGKIAAKMSADLGNYEFIIDLMNNKDVPVEVCKYAEEIIDKAVFNRIEHELNVKKTFVMDNIVRNHNLPLMLREAVGQRLIEELDRMGYAEQLLQLSGNSDLPLKIRELAGITAIYHLSTYKEMLLLVNISESKDFPDRIRDIAHTELCNTAKQIYGREIDEHNIREISKEILAFRAEHFAMILGVRHKKPEKEDKGVILEPDPKFTHNKQSSAIDRIKLKTK